MCNFGVDKYRITTSKGSTSQLKSKEAVLYVHNEEFTDKWIMKMRIQNS